MHKTKPAPLKTSLLVTALSMLCACGGGSDSEPSQTAASSSSSSSSASSSGAPSEPANEPTNDPENQSISQTSNFSSPSITGIDYRTESFEGTTNENGEFEHLSDESIVFSIGDIAFPAFQARNVDYLFELAQTDIISQTVFINTARLLISLDTDGDTANGIQISETAHLQAEGLSVSFSDTNFDAQVANLVSTSGAENTVLVSEQEAKDVITALLDTDRSCPRTSAKVGQVANLSMFSHDVAGQLRVLNDCTIQVTNFSYDGGGLGNVRFYNLDNSEIYGENLADTVFNNATLTLTVTPQQLESIDNLSVWCIPAGISFGEGRFR